MTQAVTREALPVVRVDTRPLEVDTVAGAAHLPVDSRMTDSRDTRAMISGSTKGLMITSTVAGTARNKGS